MKELEIINLGTFENKTGEFIVSDPCYDLGTWCQGKLKNILTGIWYSFVGKSDEGVWGNRCAELITRHNSVKNQDYFYWVHADFEVGVDSGQAGIFDSRIYKNNEGVVLPKDTPVNWEDEGEAWYLSCCDITLREEGAGVITGGVVSSSGYGDGGYDAYYSLNEDGKIVAVKIVFIEEE